MGPPAVPPIGLLLARTARVVTQAFERSMAEAGGSASAWQVLLLVRSGQWGTQSRMAEAMGVTGATLTHHLNGLEAQGLVQVELTAEGEALFDRLRAVAVRHDQRLRSMLSDAELAQLGDVLQRLQTGIAVEEGAPDPQAGGRASR